jgi:hypothetical protein
VPGSDGSTVAAAQEILWSIRESGGWSAPQALTSTGLLDDQPAVAVRSDGTAVVAWRHASGVDVSASGVSDLWSAEFNGTTWSTPAEMFNDGQTNGRPALTALPDGGILAIWLSSSTMTGEDAVVRCSNLASGTWTPAITISDTEADCKRCARLVSLPDGRALAFWTEEQEAGQTMLMAIRDAGSGAWGAPSAILPPQMLIGAPSIDVYDSRVTVVWHGVGEKSSLYLASCDFADANGWTTPQNLTPEAGEAWWPLAGSDQSGNLDVAYILDSASLASASGLLASGQSLILATLSVDSLADFALTTGDLSLAASPPVVGEANTVQVHVANAGIAASGVSDVRLYNGDPALGGVLVDTQPLGALQVGESADIDLEWTPAASGTYQLYVVVDTSGTVSELHEDNNQGDFSVGVIAQPSLALDAASDTGTAGDGWTTDATPTMIGTATGATSVALYVDSQTSRVACAAVIGDDYSATLPALASGPHTVWVQAFDGSGNPSPFSTPLALLIDAGPVPATPVLDPTTDSGTVGDAITNVRRPKITGTAKPSASVRLYDGGSLLAEIVATTSGTYEFVPAADWNEGLHSVTASQYDDSVGYSESSAAIDILIDATAPNADVVDITPDPRTTPVGLVTISFSEDVTGVDVGDFTLTESGTPVDMATVVVNAVSASQYTLDLTDVTSGGGSYTLTLVGAGAGITDMAGNPLTADAADGWATLVNFDTDGNGAADALTDGILILRYLFDPAGAWNYSDALGGAATRSNRENIKSFLDSGQTTVLDVDGNGAADALTDGILILRYLFDPAGAWNYSDALGTGATRTTRAEIKAYLDLWNPGLGGAGLITESSTDSASAAAEADALVEANVVTETNATVLVAAEVGAGADVVGETVTAASVVVGLPEGEIGGGEWGGDVRACVGVGCERVEGQDTLKRELQRERAVDRVDLQSVVEQEFGGSAAGELMGGRLPGGLGRGVRAAQVDSLFAEEEAEEWFDWR